jgi:hypothetical protein
MCRNNFNMKHLIASILIPFYIFTAFGQNKVTISLSGSVINFSTSEKLFGATLYFIQKGKTVGKSISDETGRYTISAIVNKDEPIDLLISKPAFASKKVLFDIKSTSATNIKLVEELIIQLHEYCEGANLSFTKTEYAEKFIWAGNSAQPDKNYKDEIDKKIISECSKVKNNINSKNLVSSGDIAFRNKDYSKAIEYYDLALKTNPNDSSIKIKKENVLSTTKKIKEEETKKENYLVKKKVADDAYKNGDIINAEKNYKELLVEFPGDSYVSGQITKIVSSKNQLELEKKNKTEVDKLIEQANSLKNSKKYDDAISKLQQAAILMPSKKAELDVEVKSIKTIQTDLQLEDQINKDLKNTAEILKNKKYDEVIKLYNVINQNIAKLSKQEAIDKYSNLSDQGAKAVLEKKNQEGEEFKKQLKKAQDNFDKGPNFYVEAEKILKGDPMKSRMNDQEVIVLSDKILKMKEFYKLKTEAYKQVNNKKDKEALSKLKATIDLTKKNGNITPQNEISQLNKSIDSLENILNPRIAPPIPSQQNNNSNQSGIQLKAPGELITDNPNNAFIELSENLENQKAMPLENMTEIKNEIDNEVDFSRKLNASRQEIDINNIQERKTEVELKAIENDKIPEQLQENLNEQKRQLEFEMYNKQVINAQQNEDRSNNVQIWKNNKDSLFAIKQFEIEQKTEADIDRFQSVKNEIEKNASKIKSQNEVLSESYQNTKENSQYLRYKKDSLNLEMVENRSNQIQQKKDYQKENILAANHIKDENGVEFPWNKMTERIYKIKNKEGYVTSIITRRVVVDKNGYGIVYEQHTNEFGANLFFKNGATTTEFVWTNESSGINVIEK